MNTKVVYAAGIALLMIGIIFYFIDSGFFTYEKPLSSSSSSYTNIDPTMTSSSTFVNNNNTSTAIGKTFVKPTSYQSFESLSPLNIEDFGKQLVVYIPKLKQPQSSSSSSSSSSIPIVSAQSTNKKTPTNYENLTVSVKSVGVVPENNVKSLQIALNVHNPNIGS